MKKFIFFIALLLCFSFISLGSVQAEASPAVKSQETSNSIELSWNLEGDTYKIYRDQKLIWEGKDKGYIDDSLEANHMYSYRIGTYNKDGNLIDVTNIKTRTKPNDFRALSFNASPLDNGELSTKLTTTVGSDYVNLEWGYLEDKDGIYEIYRDDKLIGKTGELSYFDDTVLPGKTYKYTIESKKEVSKQKKVEMEEYIEKNNLEFSKEEKEEAFTQPHSLIRLIETNEEVSEQGLKSKDLPDFMLEHEEKMKNMDDMSAAALKYSIIFRYTTFIPQKTVSPPFVSTIYKGDNRGFNFYSNAFRTRADVFAGWGLGKNELYLNPYTGITTQTKNGKTTTKKASTSGMKLTKDLVSSSKMMWRVNHDIGDPFLALFPNISMYYEGILYNNYSFEVRGSHDKAPNHEFYFALAYTEDIPGNIFKYTGGPLVNLTPGFPQRYFEFSM